jgi:hypothetical protein
MPSEETDLSFLDFAARDGTPAASALEAGSATRKPSRVTPRLGFDKLGGAGGDRTPDPQTARPKEAPEMTPTYVSCVVRACTGRHPAASTTARRRYTALARTTGACWSGSPSQGSSHAPLIKIAVAHHRGGAQP